MEPLEERALLTTGIFDAAFNHGAPVLTPFAKGHAYATAVQKDGKIVVVGEAMGAKDVDTVVARYNADGTPDQSFGKGGVIMKDLGGDDGGRAVAIQKDGKIVVGGSSKFFFFQKQPQSLLARFSADGQLDKSFGTNGQTLTYLAPGEDSTINALALQADGKVVAVGEAGTTNPGFAVARYTTEEQGDPPVVKKATGDVTSRLSIQRLKARRNKRTGRVSQPLVLTNVSGDDIAAPLTLVVSGLGKKQRLRNGTGVTHKEGPLGSPLIRLSPEDTDLLPGQSRMVQLSFSSAKGRKLSYAVKVYAGDAEV
jgi:uncharacterized delta-60 repeat protein